MGCPTARDLLAVFAAAALEHIDAVNALTDLGTLSVSNKFADAKCQVEHTDAKCRAARLALEEHQAEHHCLDEQT